MPGRDRYSPDGTEVMAGTAQGQILFWDATLKKYVPTEVTELFWDDTNKRIGINKAAPLTRLDVGGAVRGTQSLMGGVKP